MLTASAARALLVLHTAVGVAAVGAATHLVVWLRGYLRGHFARHRAVRRFAWITLVLQLCAFLAGNLIAHGDVTAAKVIIGGTPALAPDVSVAAAIGIEAVLTFFLVFVVYGSAVDARAPKIGGLAIGLTVALDILFGGPLTGGAMNVARWFGPALAAGNWTNAVVYFVGPLLGGGLAGLIYGRFLIKP